jgi:hypothetical protein
MIFTADFETTTTPDDCRVWAWALCEVGNIDNFIYNNSLSSFMDYISKNAPITLYFHNLKFDGQFILDYLFNNNFTFVKDRKDLDAKTFTTLISDSGLFYSLEICFKVSPNGKKKYLARIYDSLKIITDKVENIAKTFDAPTNKLKLDYDLYRPINHILTNKEIDYIRGDVTIMAHALNILFSQNLTNMTAGSNALSDYKNMVGRRNFDEFYPPPEYDWSIRQSYRGGFTYLNPIHKNKILNSITVLDVNSLYPWVMYECYLPYGEGMHYDGQYVYDKDRPLYIQCITCNFEIKDNKIPTIQIKNSRYFKENEYLLNSDGEDITLYLTSVDLKLFLEQYNVTNIEYIEGWKFKQSNKLFKKYIDKWIKIKNEATISGNKGMRSLSKLMLNSLYGKFATSPNVRSKIPYFDEEEKIVKYANGPEETRKPVYIPVGTFVTAYAREKTIRTSQKIKEYSLKKYKKDMYIYSDTDSIHTFLPLDDLKKIVDIDDIKLGAWKIEESCYNGKFIRQKCYVENVYHSKKDIEEFMKKEENKELLHHVDVSRETILKITCAGMPESCYKYVTFDNFQIGLQVSGKLAPKKVSGGIILKDIDFTLR